MIFVDEVNTFLLHLVEPAAVEERFFEYPVVLFVLQGAQVDDRSQLVLADEAVIVFLSS